MADPFSLTANAVGVISLGLSVCQGLVTYCSHIKSFNDDTKNVATKIRGLKDTLEALKNILSDQDAFDPNHTTDRVKTMIRSASQNIMDCDAALKKLKNALESLKVDSGLSTRKSQKAKEFLSMALYPFRRDGMMNHIVTVEGLQDNLSMALDLLKIAMGIDNQKQLLSLQTTTTTIATQGLDFQKLLHTLIQSSERQEQMINTAVSRGLKPMLEPGSVESLSNGIQQVQHTVRQTTRATRQRRIICWCQHYRNRPFETDNFISWYNLTHKEGCALYVPGQMIKVLQFKQNFLTKFLRRSIWASWETTVESGLCRIDRHLTFRAVVGDSPAMVLIDRYFRMHRRFTREEERWTTREVAIEDLHKELNLTFQRREALPGDMDDSGLTFLHLLILCYMNAPWSTRKPSKAFFNLIKDLHDQGLLLSSCLPDDKGWTPLDYLMSSQFDRPRNFNLTVSRDTDEHLISLFSILIDAGGYVSNSIYKPMYPNFLWNGHSEFLPKPSLAGALKYIPIEDIYVPEPLEPLVLRNPIILQELIKKGVDMERVLNVYASWPQGLAILLQAGYKPTHNSLGAAIYSECAESLNLFHSTCLFSVGKSDFEKAAACPILHQVIIECLVSERKHTQRLAETYLPSDQLTQIALKPGSLLGGYQAFHVCQMLKARDVDVKWARNSPWLMYDNSFVQDIELAEALWNAGFRDVDEVGEDGLTALMQRERARSNLDSLQFSNWLVKKGADLYRESPSGIPALHYLVRGIGSSYLYDAEMVQKNLHEPEILQLLETILLDPVQDSQKYTCACAVGGHCAANVYANAVSYVTSFGYLPFLHMSLIENISRPQIREILQIFAPRPAAFLRSLTFEALGIPHTCSHNSFTLDLEEIEEIQDEWKESIDLLEELLDEFLATISSSDMAFSQFVQEVWTKRMEEVLATSLTSDEICQMREIGVVLEEIE